MRCSVPDHEVASTSMRADIEWRGPGAARGPAMVEVDDVDEVVAELQRVRDLGLRGRG